MERRLDPRAEVVGRVECRVGARSEPAITYDLSSDGCLLQCPLGFVEPGDDIEMRFPHGILIQGQVIWRMRLNAGVKFSRQIPGSLIASLTLPALDATSTCQKREVLPQPVTRRSMLTPRRPFHPPAR